MSQLSGILTAMKMDEARVKSRADCRPEHNANKTERLS
jgi:hypothetical protein